MSTHDAAAASPQATTWPMWAGVETDHGATEPHFVYPALDAWYPREYGYEPVPVLVTTDPNGRYWGWIDNPEQDRRIGREPRTEPVMIWHHEGLFAMQFPYGVRAEEEAGHGRAVRLSITAADQAASGDDTHERHER